MGTFHDNMGELHGITVVVETPDGSRAWIGRCHEERPEGMLMLDVAEYAAADKPLAESIAQAARLGHWPQHKRLLVPSAEIGKVTRLGELRG